MDNSPRAYRRKNYFIKKRFQISFTYRFIALIILEAILIALLLMYVSKGTLTTAYHGTHLTIEKTPLFFFSRFLIIALVAGIAISITGIIIFIYLSHRIAGPLYRFEKTIDDISKGDVSFRINLRKTDQLKELQPHLNNLLTNIDEHAEKMKGYIDEGSAIVFGKDAGESAKLKEIFKNLKKAIDFFKTSK